MPRLPMIVKTVPANIGFFIGIGFYIAETLVFRDRLIEDYHLNLEALKPLTPVRYNQFMTTVYRES